MAKRKYSVGEIDTMRAACRTLNGSDNGSHALAEEMLRTYMQNGTDPQELSKAARDRFAQEIEWQQEVQRALNRRVG